MNMGRLRDHDSQVVPTPPMSYQAQQSFQSERTAADSKFVAAGHTTEDTGCNHLHWNFDKHGRYCTCGTCICDFGD